MKRGFTLLELLIVIGILAILATVVALILNPAELLRQARDSQRLSDLRTINSAIGLWMASASSTAMTATSTCTATGATGYGISCVINSNTGINGSGWININFSLIPGGSPLSRLPLDPSNNSTYYYQFANNIVNSTYELNANMESDKYKAGGVSDVESNSKDGGEDPNVYEIGTDPDLNLI